MPRQAGLTSIPCIDVVAAVLRDERDRILLTRRPEEAEQGGLWEFPGGKVEAGESVREAVARELHEELGLAVQGGRHLLTVSHAYPHLSVRLHVFDQLTWAGTPQPLEGQPIEWVTYDRLRDLPMPEADWPITRALALPPFYPITAPGPVDSGWWARFGRLLGHHCPSGMPMVQLRLKELAKHQLRPIIERASRLARESGIGLVVNAGGVPPRSLIEDFELAGLHLPTAVLMSLTDRPVGPDHLLGASCHSPAELAHAAQIGADFACLGPVAATSSHPQARPIGIETFGSWARDAALPVYALGGLGVESLDSIIAAGGVGVAGLSAFWR